MIHVKIKGSEELFNFSQGKIEQNGNFLLVYAAMSEFIVGIFKLDLVEYAYMTPKDKNGDL